MNAKMPGLKPAGPVQQQMAKRRWVGWVVAGLILLAAGTVVRWQFFSEPPRPWVVRWRIARYLKEQTGKRDFQTAFNLPSKTAMAKAASELGSQTNAAIQTGPITKKGFNALSAEYLDRVKELIVLRRQLAEEQQELEAKQSQLARENEGTGLASATNTAAVPSRILALRARVAALQKDLPARQQELARKEETLAPLVSDLWAFQRAWAVQQQAEEAVTASAVTAAWNQMAQDIRQRLNEATTWAAMYELIGQQLWVADRLFASANVQHRRLAMTIILHACRDALNEAQNGWLAARICEGYIWPHLDVADDTNRRAALSLENLLTECANVFRRTDEPENVLRTYRILLSKASNPQRADWARVQLAQVHEQAGEYADALRYLKAVKGTNDFAWALRRVPWLQERAKYQR
jgi:hypothetical protein